MKICNSAHLDTIESYPVHVESTFTKGLPSFTIVGLTSTSIQESKDRVKSSLLVNGYKFPPLKITVNLAPSDIKKSGTHFDLPIALLIALYNKNVDFNDFYIFGELGLDGTIKDTALIFPIILSLAKKGLVKKVLVCEESAKKVSKIPNIELFVVKNLMDAIDFFESSNKDKYKYDNFDLKYNSININSRTFYYTKSYKYDFIDVLGQDNAKFAALVSAAGNHNMIMEGSPGCGKSMISKRLRYIMPPMSLEEVLEKAKLQSLNSNNIIDFEPIRSFRMPHHSSTKASIFGGGSSNAKIGEIALCNNGILFFDELPHFSKSILEALREPLEDNKILISRVNSKILYETKFTFIAAQNPCPCGNLLSSVKECRCNELEIQRYKSRISEPLLDRIDLYVVMNDSFNDNKNQVSSEELHKNVIKAFEMQINRGQSELNGKLSDEEIKKYCILENEAKDVLDRAILNYQLSHRSINKVLKVSRTIADLNDNINITKNDLLQSLSFRKR